MVPEESWQGEEKRWYLYGGPLPELNMAENVSDDSSLKRVDRYALR